jgi:hypothetical protein
MKLSNKINQKLKVEVRFDLPPWKFKMEQIP